MDGIRTTVNLTKEVSSYNYLYVNADAQWILEPYVGIAESSLANLRNAAPYKLIKETIRYARGMPSSSAAKVRKEFLIYNAPYTALGLVSLVFAIVITVVGMVHCCRRYNVLPEEAESMNLRGHSRYYYIACLGICACFIVMSGAATLSGRTRFKEGVSLARSLVDNSFKNLLEFQNNTFEDLQFIMVKQLDETCDELVDIIHTFSRRVINATRDVAPSAAATTSALLALDSELPNLNNSFRKLFDELVDVRRLYESDLISLESPVRETNAKLSMIRNLCQQDGTLNSTGICQSPELNPKIFLLVNSTSFPVVSDLFANTLARLAGQDFAYLARKTNATISAYQEKAYGKTTLKRSDLEKIARTIKGHRDTAFRSIEDVLLNGVIVEIVDKHSQVMAKLDDSGLILIVVNTIATVMTVVSVLNLVPGTLLACGILIGLPVMAFADHSMFKGLLPKVGCKMTRSSLRQLFLFSPPMLILLSILVGICGTVTQTCIGLENGSILENVFDDVDIWGGRFFGLTKVIPEIPQSVTLTQFIDTCGHSKNSTVWHAASMDEVLDIRKKLKLDTIQDPISFFKLESLFDAGGVGSGFLTLKEGAQNLGRGFNALNSSIGYTGILLSRNLSEYGANLTAFSKRLESYDMNLSRLFESWKKNVTDYVISAAVRARNTRGTLIKISNDAIKKANETISTVNSAIKFANATEELISEVKVKFTNGTRKALAVIDQFMDHIEKELNENIGKCEFVSEAYTKGQLIFCSYILSGLNILWLSIGVTTFMFALFMYSFIKVIYYYRLKILEDRGQSSKRGKQSGNNVEAATKECEDSTRY